MATALTHRSDGKQQPMQYLHVYSISMPKNYIYIRSLSPNNFLIVSTEVNLTVWQNNLMHSPGQVVYSGFVRAFFSATGEMRLIRAEFGGWKAKTMSSKRLKGFVELRGSVALVIIVLGFVTMSNTSHNTLLIDRLLIYKYRLAQLYDSWTGCSVLF